MSTPHQTRRQRKAASAPKEEITIEEVPLATPDYDAKPTGKTLFDLAAERQAELQAQADVLNAKRAKEKGQNGSADAKSKGGEGAKKGLEGMRLAGVDGPAAVGGLAKGEDAPLLTSLLYATSLTMVHYTLDILVQHQYAQELSYTAPIKRLATVFPTVALMSYTSSVPPIATFPALRQLLFLAMAIGTGCYGLRLGNDEPYLAVMKYFPPAGVACLWAVCEMEVAFTGIFVLAMGGYAWWKGLLFY